MADEYMAESPCEENRIKELEAELAVKERANEKLAQKNSYQGCMLAKLRYENTITSNMVHVLGVEIQALLTSEEEAGATTTTTTTTLTALRELHNFIEEFIAVEENRRKRTRNEDD